MLSEHAGVRDFLAVCGNRQMASMASKFEVVKFDGTRNFGLWQTRVKDLSISKVLSDGDVIPDLPSDCDNYRFGGA
jgi:hypothetical protein